MHKTVTYGSFTIATLIVLFAFLTAKTYTQLAIAVVLYPFLAYLAFNIFPRKVLKEQKTDSHVQPQTKSFEKPKKIEIVADVDKRSFIKIAGAAGLSFFVFSMLGRRVDSLLFGTSQSQNTNSTTNQPTNQSANSNTSLTDGYKISEIDNGTISYYGFTNQTGGWLIMKEDTQTSSFRYAKGDVKFANDWTNRENLKYDYYYKLF